MIALLEDILFGWYQSYYLGPPELTGVSVILFCFPGIFIHNAANCICIGSSFLVHHCVY